MRYSFSLFIILWLLSQFAWSQNKYEKEFRISKSEFPSKAIDLISERLSSAKRVRFYQEIDSTKRSFEVKFKKERLHYSVEFDENGKLEDIEFIIKEADIPEDCLSLIKNYLKQEFQKVRVIKIQQQYPVGTKPIEKVVSDAFQNLILPYINYELVFASKGNRGFQEYEALFDSQGQFLNLRKSLSRTYDHVLY